MQPVRINTIGNELRISCCIIITQFHNFTNNLNRCCDFGNNHTMTAIVGIWQYCLQIGIDFSSLPIEIDSKIRKLCDYQAAKVPNSLLII